MVSGEQDAACVVSERRATRWETQASHGAGSTKTCCLLSLSIRSFPALEWTSVYINLLLQMFDYCTSLYSFALWIKSWSRLSLFLWCSYLSSCWTSLSYQVRCRKVKNPKPNWFNQHRIRRFSDLPSTDQFLIFKHQIFWNSNTLNRIVGLYRLPTPSQERERPRGESQQAAWHWLCSTGPVGQMD